MAYTEEELKVLSEREAKGEALTEEELNALTDYNISILAQEEKARESDIAKKESQRQEDVKKRDRIAGDVFYGAKTGVELAKLSNAIAQIRKSNKAMERLKKTRPQLAQFIDSPELKQRLGEAAGQRQFGLSPRALGAYEGQAAQARQTALDVARQVSGGQAGVYGSQAQKAALDQLRSGENLALLEEQSRAAKTRDYDRLIGLDLQQKALAQSRIDRNTDQRLADYRRELQGAQSLGLAGRQNLYNFGEQLPYLAGNLARNYALYDKQRGISREPRSTQQTNIPPSGQPQPLMPQYDINVQDPNLGREVYTQDPMVDPYRISYMYDREANDLLNRDDY